MLTYDDAFLIDSIDPDTLERIEAAMTKEVNLLISGIENIDPDIKNTLIIYKVYQRIASMQFEADGMADKYKIYNELFKSLITTIRSGSTDASTVITSIKVQRG